MHNSFFWFRSQPFSLVYLMLTPLVFSQIRKQLITMLTFLFFSFLFFMNIFNMLIKIEHAAHHFIAYLAKRNLLWSYWFWVQVDIYKVILQMCFPTQSLVTIMTNKLLLSMTKKMNVQSALIWKFLLTKLAFERSFLYMTFFMLKYQVLSDKPSITLLTLEVFVCCMSFSLVPRQIFLL